MSIRHPSTARAAAATNSLVVLDERCLRFEIGADADDDLAMAVLRHIDVLLQLAASAMSAYLREASGRSDLRVIVSDEQM